VSYTEETAKMLFAALCASSVAVLDEAARINDRWQELGRHTNDQHRVVKARLIALGWRKP
jgi:hypothetical protein